MGETIGGIIGDARLSLSFLPLLGTNKPNNEGRSLPLPLMSMLVYGIGESIVDGVDARVDNVPSENVDAESISVNGVLCFLTGLPVG